MLGLGIWGNWKSGYWAVPCGPGGRAAAVELPVPQREHDHVGEPDRAAGGEQRSGGATGPPFTISQISRTAEAALATLISTISARLT